MSVIENSTTQEIDESPIIISDSDDYDDSESESEMETDWLRSFFNSSTDSFAKKSLIDDKVRIQSWLLQIFRKCRMLGEIYQLQKDASNRSDPLLIGKLVCPVDTTRRLAELLTHVRERNLNKKSSFFMFGELLDILKNTPDSALLNPACYTKVCYILEEFGLGPSLEQDRFPVLQNYLRSRYRSKNCSIESIFHAWRKSDNFSDEMEELVIQKRKFIEALLWGPVFIKLEAMIAENARIFPTIQEIGTFDVSKFQRFLETFNISFCGPYKTICPLGNSRPKIVYFVSSMNPCDSIANGGFPLYGRYEFKAAALNKTCEESALQFISTLEFPPFWLSMIPPIFNESLGHYRQHFIGI